MSRSTFVLTPALKAIIAESARNIFGHLPVVPYRTGINIVLIGIFCFNFNNVFIISL